MRRLVAITAVVLSAALSVAAPTMQAQARIPVASVPPRTEVHEATVTDLQQALTAGRTTSVALVRAYLARIAAYDQQGPALNAILRRNPGALREAAARDAERTAGTVRGPLHGIPIILKDNYDTGDMPTTAGSLALATSQPARDGFVVQQLRAAGAIVLAKANMHELAAGITNISSLGGQTRNPYDPARCPGGSSGGTGAAIAASFAAVGWGSDTCGSIRIPSAFGALFGLRPSIGMVSRTGIVPLSHSQDIGGPLARTVTDLAIALDATVGYDAADKSTVGIRDRRPQFTAALDRHALQGARIGLFLPYFRDTDSEIADSVRAAIAGMRARGATVIDVPMAEFDTLIANTSVINMEMKADLAAYLAMVPNAPARTLGDIVAMERLLDSLQLDAIAYPTVRQKPVFPGQVQPGSTCPLGAQSGLPSIAMPAGFTADGLPVSVELLGTSFSDVRLVSMAYAFEQLGPRRRAPSSTPALVNGAAPVATPRVLTTRVGTAVVTTTLTVDPVRRELRWRTTTSAPVAAVVLRRQGGGTISGPASGTSGSAPAIARVTIPDNAERVVARLMGPDARQAQGTMPLGYAELEAYQNGRLSVAITSASGETREARIARPN